MKHIAKQAKQLAEKAKGNCNPHFQNFHISNEAGLKAFLQKKRFQKSEHGLFYQKKWSNQKKKFFLFLFLDKVYKCGIWSYCLSKEFTCKIKKTYLLSTD